MASPTNKSSPVVWKYPLRDEASIAVSQNVGDLINATFGEGYILDPDMGIQHDPKTDTWHIHLIYESESAICPKCGQPSFKQKSKKYRHPKCMPINGKKVIAHIQLHSYKCSHCKGKNGNDLVFTEELPGFRHNQHHADLLNELILSLGVFCSAPAAVQILKNMGIDVSKNTVTRILDRIEVQDDSNVRKIGIDDVSSRKGRSYYTIIYDADTHIILALLKGRDGKELEEWLKKHPAVEVVCRDRDSSFAAAVRRILGKDIQQIADRFHLFQNLTEYLRKAFAAYLYRKIYTQNGDILPGEPDKIAVPPDSELLDKMDYDNSPPLDESGDPIQFFAKKRDLNSKQYESQAAGRLEKYKKIRKIRNIWEKSMDPGAEKVTKKELAGRFNLSPVSLNKYLKMSEEEVEKIKEIREYKKRDTPANPYLNMIYKMIRDDQKPLMILHYVMNKGYSGSRRSLEALIYSMARENFRKKYHHIYDFMDDKEYPKDVEVLKQSDILRYILINDKDSDNEQKVGKAFSQLCDRYPIISKASQIWNEFHHLVMENDDPSKLDVFLEKYEKDPDIGSFINGIKKDIAAVKNAISCDLSSGFVEGGNTKYKLFLRMCYGRGGIKHLFQRLYASFLLLREQATPHSLLNSWFASQ